MTFNDLKFICNNFIFYSAYSFRYKNNKPRLFLCPCTDPITCCSCSFIYASCKKSSTVCSLITDGIAEAEVAPLFRKRNQSNEMKIKRGS